MKNRKKQENTKVIYEPIRRSDLQEMEGLSIKKVTVDGASRSILFVLQDKQGEKTAYGFKISDFLDDVIITRSMVIEV